MAKSKQQKREEALSRQMESFKRSQKWLIEMSNTSGKCYDAADHQLAWDNAVNSAYAARVDIHGNYLPEPCYKKPWQFSEDADPKWLAENATAFTLEELRQKLDASGCSLFKNAYGTRPFVADCKDPYDVNSGASILAFLVSKMMKR